MEKITPDSQKRLELDLNKISSKKEDKQVSFKELPRTPEKKKDPKKESMLAEGIDSWSKLVEDCLTKVNFSKNTKEEQGKEEEKLVSNEKMYEEIEIKACPKCQRSFNLLSFPKHVKICQKEKKERVPFKTNYREQFLGQFEDIQKCQSSKCQKQKNLKVETSNQKDKKNYLWQKIKQQIKEEKLKKSPVSSPFFVIKRCPTCKRSFNEIAIDRHTKICEKVFQKNKENKRQPFKPNYKKQVEDQYQLQLEEQQQIQQYLNYNCKPKLETYLEQLSEYESMDSEEFKNETKVYQCQSSQTQEDEIKIDSGFKKEPMTVESLDLSKLKQNLKQEQQKFKISPDLSPFCIQNMFDHNTTQPKLKPKIYVSKLTQSPLFIETLFDDQIIPTKNSTYLETLRKLNDISPLCIQNLFDQNPILSEPNLDKLVACRKCSRKFIPERIEKHENICFQLKERRVFKEKDLKTQESQPIASNWKQREEEFRNAFKQSNKLNLDKLVACRKCSRKFMPDRIEKHENICLQLKERRILKKKELKTQESQPIASNWKQRASEFRNAIKQKKQEEKSIFYEDNLKSLEVIQEELNSCQQNFLKMKRQFLHKNSGKLAFQSTKIPDEGLTQKENQFESLPNFQGKNQNLFYKLIDIKKEFELLQTEDDLYLDLGFIQKLTKNEVFYSYILNVFEQVFLKYNPNTNNLSFSCLTLLKNTKKPQYSELVSILLFQMSSTKKYFLRNRITDLIVNKICSKGSNIRKQILQMLECALKTPKLCKNNLALNLIMDVYLQIVNIYGILSLENQLTPIDLVVSLSNHQDPEIRHKSIQLGLILYQHLGNMALYFLNQPSKTSQTVKRQILAYIKVHKNSFNFKQTLISSQELGNSILCETQSQSLLLNSQLFNLQYVFEPLIEIDNVPKMLAYTKNLLDYEQTVNELEISHFWIIDAIILAINQKNYTMLDKIIQDAQQLKNQPQRLDLSTLLDVFESFLSNGNLQYCEQQSYNPNQLITLQCIDIAGYLLTKLKDFIPFRESDRFVDILLGFLQNKEFLKCPQISEKVLLNFKKMINAGALNSKLLSTILLENIKNLETLRLEAVQVPFLNLCEYLLMEKLRSQKMAKIQFQNFFDQKEVTFLKKLQKILERKVSLNTLSPKTKVISMNLLAMLQISFNSFTKEDKRGQNYVLTPYITKLEFMLEKSLLTNTEVSKALNQLKIKKEPIFTLEQKRENELLSFIFAKK